MRDTLCIILEIETSIINWAFDHIPTIATCLCLIVIGSWITWLVRGWLETLRNHFRKIEVRFTKIETDIVQLKTTQAVFDKRLGRVEKRLTRVEKKLDSLIAMFKLSISQSSTPNQ